LLSGVISFDLRFLINAAGYFMKGVSVSIPILSEAVFKALAPRSLDGKEDRACKVPVAEVEYTMLLRPGGSFERRKVKIKTTFGPHAFKWR